MAIPRADYPYVQKILANADMPIWRKAKLIAAFDCEKRDEEQRSSGRYRPWTPPNVGLIEMEIEEMEA